MTIEVKELEDGTFEINWDENDPYESALNDWTEDMFLDFIMEGVRQAMTQDESETETD